MSYATHFSLLSFHLPDHDDSAEERLRWPLAGSLVMHVGVCMVFLSLGFGSSLEQSSGSYEVTLVTLPEPAVSPPPAPEKKSMPEQSAEKALPPKVEVEEAKAEAVEMKAAAAPQKEAVNPPSPVPQETPRVLEQQSVEKAPPPKAEVAEVKAVAVPQRETVSPPSPVPQETPRVLEQQNVEKAPPPKVEVKEAKAEAVEMKAAAAPQKEAVSPPSPVPQEKPRVPERVTDSLMSALESVAVPKPQVPVVPQKAAPRPAPAPSPVKQSPAVEADVEPIKAPPQPPKLAIGKSETPTSTTKVEPVAQILKLKQAVETIVVPKKPKQASSRVSPTVTPDGEQKQDTTSAPQASDITLPSKAPRLAALEVPKQKTPLPTARKSRTAKSLTTKSRTTQPVSKADTRVPAPSPKRPKGAKARNVSPPIVPPQAPELARVSEKQAPVSSQPTVPVTASEPDTLERELAKLPVPEVPDFDAPPVFKQTESGGKATFGLLPAKSCSPKNPYWKNVNKKIDDIHDKNYGYTRRVESPAVLTFRVKRNGQVSDLAVVRSSGNKKFDLAAKRAVLAAAPLPPFPANMPKPSCMVQHTFNLTR